MIQYQKNVSGGALIFNTLFYESVGKVFFAFTSYFNN